MSAKRWPSTSALCAADVPSTHVSSQSPIPMPTRVFRFVTENDSTRVISRHEFDKKVADRGISFSHFLASLRVRVATEIECTCPAFGNAVYAVCKHVLAVRSFVSLVPSPVSAPLPPRQPLQHVPVNSLQLRSLTFCPLCRSEGAAPNWMVAPENPLIFSLIFW